MPLTTDMVRWADLVLVMEGAQLLQLRDVASAASAKTFLLGHFASSATTDIRDPYAGTPEDFQRCYAIIEDACEGFLGSIVGRASEPALHLRPLVGNALRTVLHLSSTSGPGGAETLVKSLASSLDPARFRSIACLFRRGWLYDAMLDLGIPTSVIGIDGAFDLRWARAFAALVRKERVAVIHAHEFTANAYGSLIGQIVRRARGGHRARKKLLRRSRKAPHGLPVRQPRVAHGRGFAGPEALHRRACRRRGASGRRHLQRGGRVGSCRRRSTQARFGPSWA